MTSEVSVSKGVFVSKNGFQRSTKRFKNRVKKKNKFSNYIWYQSYKSLWKNIEAKLHVISSEMFSSTLSDLVKFVQSSCREKLDEIPTAALLTGINMPDHEAQFSTLTKEIKENVSPHCVTLRGQDCHTLKLFVENMVNDFLNDEESDINDLYYEDDGVTYVKKSQCNFAVLQAWYENLYMNKSILNYSGSDSPKKTNMLPVAKPLVVIIPDLENFNEDVVQDFILIAHSYLNILPFILIFGVATSVKALHRTMPYHVSSKTNIKVFSSQPSTVYLNNVLENVLLTDNCPFLLGKKIFNLFVDIFLFYDQSVTGFIKNFKYAMMEHFSQGNVWALCSNENPADIFDSFLKEDYENLRKLYSFRDLVERQPYYKNQIKLLTDDRYLRDVAIDKILVLKKHIYLLHLFLRCLHILVRDLPQNPLGKQVRELYTNSNGITESPYFKECFKLLSFQSKDEFCTKLATIVGIIENNLSTKDLSVDLVGIYEKLEVYLKELKNIGNMQVQDTSENVLLEKSVNRQQFKQNLIKISQTNSMNCFGKLREEIVDYLRSIFEKYLVNYQKFHFHEIFFFNNSAIENQIIGTHRSAIHTALNNPRTYLQCSCCETRSDGNILPTMPDLSVVYKLHLECGKMINLYDWLQAFLSIIDPTDEEDESKRRVDPELQARFTQAIVEMEYLGFIKTSRRKTDHVQRLTWGG